MKINYKNLILSAAIGYQWSELKIFVKSLRKISKDRVILIVDKNINEITKKKFNHYDIEYIANSKKIITVLLKKDMRFINLFWKDLSISQKKYY